MKLFTTMNNTGDAHVLCGCRSPSQIMGSVWEVLKGSSTSMSKKKIYGGFETTNWGLASGMPTILLMHTWEVGERGYLGYHVKRGLAIVILSHSLSQGRWKSKIDFKQLLGELEWDTLISMSKQNYLFIFLLILSGKGPGERARMSWQTHLQMVFLNKSC